MAKIKRRKATTPPAGDDAVFFKVELQGVKQGAIIDVKKGGNKFAAKERFMELFGILSTDRKVIATEEVFDHGLPVIPFGNSKGEVPHQFEGEGIIDYFHKGTDPRVLEDVDEDE